MNLDKMRDDFEKALAEFAKLPAAQFKSYRSDDQHYANTPGDGVARGELEIGWWAWQASRAELVVTGLYFSEAGATDGDAVELAMKYAIGRVEAAGVSVKP